MRCSTCGKELKKGEFCCPRRCIRCGAPIPLGSRRQYCSIICQAKASDGAKKGQKKAHFCRGCGRKLTPPRWKWCKSCATIRKKAREEVRKAKEAEATKPKVKRGYRWVWKPDHPRAKQGYVREDELILEKHLGRPLRGDETVFHKNLDTLDNRVQNLRYCRNRQEAGALRRSACGAVAKFLRDRKLLKPFEEFLKENVYGDGG